MVAFILPRHKCAFEPSKKPRYITKKKKRVYGPLGELVSDDVEETLKDPVGWTNETMWHLAIETLAREEGTTVEAIEDGIVKLVTLLPSLEQKMEQMKPGDVARLGCQADAVARRIIRARSVLPHTNLDVALSRRPALLLWEEGRLEEGYRKAVELLVPGLSEERLGKLIERIPQILEPATVTAVVDEIFRLMPDVDPGRLLLSSPEMIYTLQSLSREERGDRDENYLEGIFRAC